MASAYAAQNVDVNRQLALHPSYKIPLNVEQIKEQREYNSKFTKFQEYCMLESYHDVHVARDNVHVRTFFCVTSDETCWYDS